MAASGEGSAEPEQKAGKGDSSSNGRVVLEPATEAYENCAKRSDGDEMPALAPSEKFKEMKRSMFNPLQGCGRGKIWAEDAKAQLAYVEFKLHAIQARNKAICNANIGKRQLLRLQLGAIPLPDGQIKATCRSVEKLLLDARRAAYGQCPRYRPFLSWWSGTGTEAAYRKIHYAEAAIARLYSKAEIVAEIPDVVRRLNAALPADNPSRILANSYLTNNRGAKACTGAELSFLIALGHEASDRNRAKLRVFRNVMLIGILVMTLVLAGVTVLTWLNPKLAPLCFVHEAAEKTNFTVSCPTSDSFSLNSVSSADVFAIALMGIIGGALSGAIFIRGMSSNPTPYNVGIPLALLKLPFGGLTALVGTLLLAGDFVPGFTAIDKQTQILAYAVVFGFAQQFFTRYLDQRAENLIANLPSKSKDENQKTAPSNSVISPMATTE